MPASPPPASWPTPVVSSYCSSGGCPPAAVAANLSAISAFSTLAYYVERDGSLQTCGPTYPACTWDIGNVDQFNAQTAHDTGAAYEVPRRRGFDVDLGEDSMRDSSFSGRRGRATT